MSSQKLSAFEHSALAALAPRAGLAAALLDAWAELPPDTVQTVRSLIDCAQLGVTEERAAAEVLDATCLVGLAERVASGFRARPAAYPAFRRLAFALNAVDFYRTRVHRDRTRVQVVLTKPPRPSVLEQRLSDLGWRTSDIEPTEHAFNAMVREAKRRVVVMTPFFDTRGATWLQELLSHVPLGVELVLVLRSLEDRTRTDYPVGFESLEPWLREHRVKVYNYSIPRSLSAGRETFHAKVVLCDQTHAYLGSSNVTAASLEHSMEMGVVLEGRAATEVGVVVDAVLASATPII